MMRLLSMPSLRLRSVLSRKAVEHELDEELRYHLEREIDENIARGHNPQEARYQALQSIKYIELRKEECRDWRQLNWIEHTFRDASHALRVLGREPRFAVTTILSLALAIGMATSVFVALNSLLLRPVALPQPDRLAVLCDHNGDERAVVSFADFEDWRQGSQTFESAAAYNGYYRPTMSRKNQAQRLFGLRVSHDYFRVLKIRPALGRFFLPTEDWDGNDHVVVLSYALWRNRFGANRQIIGQPISLDGRAETVVGVAAADAGSLPRSLGGTPPEIYRPVGELPGEKSRDGQHLQAIVRLKPGATLAQSQAELDVLCRNMERQHPVLDAKLAIQIAGLQTVLTRHLRSALIGLQMAVFLVVLIACASVANLSLARWSYRRQELAVRIALGATASRLIRMLVVESLVLSSLGGLLGVALAFLSGAILTATATRILPDAIDFPVDWRVLAFASILSMSTALLFGLAPVWQLFISGGSLREGGRGVVGQRKQTLRQVLAAGQVAIALLLLISASLLTRSFVRLRSVNPGFDPAKVLTAGMNLSSVRYATDQSRVTFYRQLLGQLASLPDVSKAALVTPLPFSGDFDRTGFEIPGRKYAPGEQDYLDRYVVTPGYFAAIKIRLIEGRLFQDRDDAEHPNVALVSQTAAHRLWPGESPIGKILRAGSASGDFDRSPLRRIVGVVADVAQYGLGLAPTAQVYMPHAQYADRGVTLLLKTTGDPLRLLEPLRRTVRALDAEQVTYDEIPFASLVADSIGARHMAVWIIGVFAGCAFLLAAGGIYGVVSYTVAQRRQEFGIRIAVGARPPDITREAVRSALPMIITGVIIGVAAAFATGQALRSFLFGIAPGDLASFGLVPAGMLAVALLACYLPARQSAKLNPIAALRVE